MTDTESTGAAIASGWALLGVALLFSSAIYRLGGRGLDVIRGGGLTPFQWVSFAVLAIAFFFGEGVLFLGRRWVPRVVARACALPGERNPVLKVLAPLYAMSLVGAPRRDTLRAWTVTASIVTAVVVVRTFPEPWRGIVDFAVASALAWSLVLIVAKLPTVIR